MYPGAPSPGSGGMQQPHFMALHPSFRYSRYLIRRKILTFFGAKLHVFNETGQVILFCKMKAFKLKEDIRIYSDETMSQPLLMIRARKVLDLASAYDVYDVSAGSEYHIGALKRKGLKSLVRDEWEIWDTRDQPIGKIQEESGALAILRRVVDLVSLIAPQKFVFSLNNVIVGHMRQNFNPFVMKLTADFSPDPMGYMDRRLAMAAATLLCVIEGKQK